MAVLSNMSRRVVVIVSVISVISVLLVNLIMFMMAKDDDISISKCEEILPIVCEEKGEEETVDIKFKEVKALGERSFDEDESQNRFSSIFEDQSREEFDEYLYDREINICLSILMVDCRKEQLPRSFSLYKNQTRFNVKIVHVYAQNDNYPKDARENFIIYPEEVEYTSILKKVFFGFEFFYEYMDECDFFMRMDDDIYINWDDYTSILSTTTDLHDTWLGRYVKGDKVKVNLQKSSKWYNIDYQIYTGGRKTYLAFTYGQTFGMGRNLYKCMIDEGRRRINEERNLIDPQKKWINGRNEDVHMGILATECKYNVRDMTNRYNGNYLVGIMHMNWKGLLVSHYYYENRETCETMDLVAEKWMV